MNGRRLAAVQIATIALIAALGLPAQSLAAPAKESFPTGFMWGTASSGFQSEMGGGSANSDPNTDWWQWVRDPAQIASKHVSGDLPENGPGAWQENYATDIALAKSLGLNSWRMGIEWSRIFPNSTASVSIGSSVTTANLNALDALADQTAVNKYRSILTAARAANLKPFVTLSHFTLPLWIHDPSAVRAAFGSRGTDSAIPTGMTKAGWLAGSTVTEFRKYAAYLAWKFGDLVDWWTPINEPMVQAVGAYANVPNAYASWFPPGLYSYRAALTAVTNMDYANAAAYDEIHHYDSRDSDSDGKKSRVGLVQNMIHFTPASASKSIDTAATVHADKLFNRTFPDAAIKGQYDLNATGKVVLTEAASYKLPLIVTENGIADASDSRRSAFLVQHLNRAWKVTKSKPSGVSLLGWFHWSLTDNFEWSAGYLPKFGLYSFSPTTLARTARPSAALVGAIAKNNSLSSSQLSRWLTSPQSR